MGKRYDQMENIYIETTGSEHDLFWNVEVFPLEWRTARLTASSVPPTAVCQIGYPGWLLVEQRLCVAISVAGGKDDTGGGERREKRTRSPCPAPSLNFARTPISLKKTGVLAFLCVSSA